jgi:hypothetical protein
MRLHSPASVLSAVIFNALIIIALIQSRCAAPARGAAAVTLRCNILVYGVGGPVMPFPFIKLIDVSCRGWGWLGEEPMKETLRRRLAAGVHRAGVCLPASDRWHRRAVFRTRPPAR